ncbi:blr1650 [Bradyrhizobium diazoefficiens USDA 110]|uniref:Blr1650 protein n=1 Tax=Bradyrhizobium diazoefficiens (strain JCM 10833 / BCRC 13528 / IAM 13628 / NBRC 14792 / USDA 110) TaxID=224911 RepID=Q89TX3_BRADU|nr:hypothetical protein CO678_43070 [Bradyrhizobium diazoefficiens]QBP20559.1 hypothetical protein Bdiaspc4_08350 [Bradyrhizobium diazoefficiens]BAC46915.1 blr1650 [Bradyrhizobium diazoefficiens USDA 110]
MEAGASARLSFSPNGREKGSLAIYRFRIDGNSQIVLAIAALAPTNGRRASRPGYPARIAAARCRRWRRCTGTVLSGLSARQRPADAGVAAKIPAKIVDWIGDGLGGAIYPRLRSISHCFALSPACL